MGKGIKISELKYEHMPDPPPESRIELIKYFPPEEAEAPIVRVYGRYIILAQNKDDLATKFHKLRRGNPEGFLKTKAFVVTQDIETGDKIFCPNYLSGPSPFDNCEVEGNFIHVYNSGRQISTEKKEDCYKILGEASPFATFVKDGEKYEVKELPVCHFNDNKVLCVYPDCPCEDDGFKRFDVKCPCCEDFK